MTVGARVGPAPPRTGRYPRAAAETGRSSWRRTGVHSPTVRQGWVSGGHPECADRAFGPAGTRHRCRGELFKPNGSFEFHPDPWLRSVPWHMQVTCLDNGLAMVWLPGALAVFADATLAPVGATESELAEQAAASLSNLCHRPVALLYAFQVHSPLIFVYQAAGPTQPGVRLVGNCDGLMTVEPWVALQVRNADCLPVALVGDGGIAMLHAGWRGLAGDLLGGAVRRFENELGVTAGHLSAVVGVGVGPCHYPVGADVIDALGRLATGGKDWLREGRVDLAAWATGRLQALGVPAPRLRVLAGCTACEARFHSYRRDHERAGRQWSTLMLTPGLEPIATPSAP